VTCIDILNDIPHYIKTTKKMTVTSVNPQIIVEGQKYPEIIKFIEESTYRIPDGIGIVMVSKMTGGKIKERVAGFEVMVKFLEYANQHQHRVFFYGAKPDVLQDAMKNIQTKYPNLNIVGGIDGYTTLTEEQVINKMNIARSDFVFVGLGFPKQEQWLSKNVNQVKASIFQDVGGSFDVLSGHVKRAPQFFIDYHLEWLYRSLSNPKRIGRIFQLPIFVVKSLWWKFGQKNKEI
jgi:N-acetylglucosaminyldiphosphoundecaprenol N-acetyl-beta-D-mannosaminyltransferase